MRARYESLVVRLEELSRLNGVMGIISWDQEVMMPPGAADARAGQVATLAGIIHEKATDPKIGEWLDRLLADGDGDFDAFERCNIREAKREYDRETKVPKNLVQEIAELGSRGNDIWVKARRENKFSDFAPIISRFIELKTQWAHCIDPHKHPYDINIDAFERSMTMAQIDPIFEKLKAHLIPLIRAIKGSGYRPDDAFLRGSFPLDTQKELGRRISADIGFSFDQGRMDVSAHPFCGGAHPTDVRITTRYRENDFIESLYAVVHETGHALYEQGRMEKDRDLPVSEALSMGIHESQSLFWERMIAQGRSFCTRYLDLLASCFPANLKGIDVGRFYEAVNISEPSLIRVEADEVTYPMHVILRYEIEKGLFDGSIAVEQLPRVWTEKMEQYLGIRPPNDSQGVLQDIHWSHGSFGYFPSYTLGAIYASQFYSAVKKSLPDVESRIENGDFVSIKTWLNENIHKKGKLYSSDELARQVTGESLNPEHFLGYLREKYRAIYRLKL